MTKGPTLLRLLRGISSSASECFFTSLVRELADSLGADFAFVAELTAQEPFVARTVSLWGDGSLLPNIEYEMSVTPCLEVIEHGYRCVPSGARACFPRDDFFRRQQIESYAGIPLIDDGALVGWLAVMHRRPFNDRDLVHAILEFMAARATAELRARILHEALSHAHSRALRDELTALPNRIHFEQQLEVALDSARPFAVLFLDLDRFKVINDSLGHFAGDALLVEAAARIRSVLRPCDIAARLGGDEFTVLLDGAGELDAEETARRIERELRRPFSIGAQQVYTTASIGIACSRGQYRNGGEILRDADTAMNRAKGAGKARFELFHTGMHVEALDRLQIEMDLHDAVAHDELRLVYQPILALRNRELSGLEALVRWQHPRRGLIMPGTFIPIAEETGAIVPLGQWVLDRVCRDLHRWPGTIMNVNLSALQLQQPDLVEHIDEILRRRGVPSRAVRLEVTESAIARDPDAAARTLHSIRALGIQLCIDDFGIGYSSLASLLHIPFTSLKIDRSLVAGVATSVEHREMVASIVTLAHNLGVGIVAEGVETAEQYDIVESMGVDFVQGYYISMPRPAEELMVGMVN